MAKEGSTIGGLMDSLGTAISVALQYGVPVESLVTKFAHQRFEPMGMTTNADIPFAKSLVDYIFRWLGMQFIDGYRDLNSPRRAHATTESAQRDGARDGNDTTRAASSGSAAAASKEVAGCSTGSSLTGGWNARREAAIEAARIDRGEPADSTSGPQARLSATHSVVSVSESRSSDGRMVESIASVERTVRTVAVNALDQSNASLMGDAPACDGCGSITVRNGTCYRCLNCGNSMGCS
jgi:ribonucleoside-diphosphate reductase alpha chain